MDGRKASGILAALWLVAACSAPIEEETVRGGRAAVTQRPFDKNTLLDDKSMRDADAMSVADVQKFLDKTPWGTKSALASYEEDGKSAAQLMHDAATKHGINPLEMLVRVQMEQGLVSKTSAPATTISLAFGCGCPHSPVCSDAYRGFANQAECAAGTLRRSMDRAITSQGTVSGWKRSSSKESQDGISITPTNAVTAALYTYTPWVGEAGGGRQGVGGVSLHHQVWGRFAEAASYGAWATQSNEPEAEEPGGATDPPAGDPPAGEPPTSEGEGESEPPPGSGDPTPPSGGADAGPPRDDPSGSDAPPSDGSNDDAILGEGSMPPSSNAPPPKPKGKTPTRPEDLPQASEEELAAKKKTAEGCAMSGGSSHAGLSNALLVASAIAMAASRARRRRD
ncbi:MAG: hypothetical protein KF819_04605 [Labilithrix sp.]|nr:hypothetical protein [Labilithrix sp.]